MHTIRFSCTITHYIEIKLTLRGFRTYKYFSLGGTIPFSIELEMMNQCLHTACDLPLGWWGYFGVLHAIWAGGNAFQGLVHNPQALLHLKHAHQVTIIDIAVGTHWDIKIELFVATIRKCLTRIPYYATAP